MRLTLLAFATLLSSLSFAQVRTQLVVEHFTNTNCAICGSRNPALISNLNTSNTDVLHISYYPSRPYADCKLNQHNSKENDDRTKYYNLYGSTPQIAVQGEALSRPNFSNTGLFDDYRGQTQPFEVTTGYQVTRDSIIVQVVVDVVKRSSIDSLNLYVIVVEDTVFYKGRNSEREHYNVFRKALTSIQGDPIKTTLPGSDSLVYRYAIALHQDWDASRMYALALVQNPFTKEIYQVGKGREKDLTITSVTYSSDDLLNVYPSAVNDVLNVQMRGLNNNAEYEIISLTGKVEMRGALLNTGVNVSTLPKGVYLIRVDSNTISSITRFVKL